MNHKLILAVLAIVCLGTNALAQTQTIRAFSHRGGRMERDENTLIAFQESWDGGYTGFETDIRMSKDGVLYVTHDATLDRTTNGSGTLEHMMSADIDKLRTKKGNRILKAEELAAFFNDKDSLYVEWELKTDPNLYPQERMEEFVEKVYAVANTVRTKGSEFVFTSGDYRALRHLQIHHPEANLLFISGRPICDETINFAKITGITTLGCTMNGTSREMVAKAHKAGITVSLWPGSSVEDFMLGAYLGADRMCTDVPLTVKAWMEKNAPWIKVRY